MQHLEGSGTPVLYI